VYDGGTIRLVDRGFSTTIHELTHYMEDRVPDLSLLEKAFWEYRCPDGKISRLKNYGSATGNPDNFPDSYGGRVYRGEKFWELATTGMQAIKSGGGNMEDSEYRDFVAGFLLLAGREKK
jgi:hypothetical protein